PAVGMAFGRRPLRDDRGAPGHRQPERVAPVVQGVGQQGPRIDHAAVARLERRGGEDDPGDDGAGARGAAGWWHGMVVVAVADVVAAVVVVLAVVPVHAQRLPRPWGGHYSSSRAPAKTLWEPVAAESCGVPWEPVAAPARAVPWGQPRPWTRVPIGSPCRMRSSWPGCSMSKMRSGMSLSRHSAKAAVSITCRSRPMTWS